MNCYACNKELEPVFKGSKTQFSNALVVAFMGGYAMFVDDYVKQENAEADYIATICHECAHEICEQVPWIERLIDSETSHSHTQSFHEANPDHGGN